MTLNILAWELGFLAELRTHHSVINGGIIIKICLVMQTLFHCSSALGPLVSPSALLAIIRRGNFGQPLISNGLQLYVWWPKFGPFLPSFCAFRYVLLPKSRRVLAEASMPPLVIHTESKHNDTISKDS